MPGLDSLNITVALLLVICAATLPVMLIAFRRRAGQEAAAYLLIILALVALLVHLGEALRHAGLLALPDPTFRILELYALLAQALVLVLCLQSFLRLGHSERWLIFGVVWISLIAVIIYRIVPLPLVALSSGQVLVLYDQLPLMLLVLGWSILMTAAVLSLRRMLRQTRQPLHRNRLEYWMPALALLIAADALVLLSGSVLSGFVQLAGLYLVAYIIVTHEVPDARDLTRRVIIYLITTVLILLVYISGYGATQFILQSASSFNPLVAGAVIALAIATLFSPLLSLVRRVVTQWFARDYYDSGAILHDYSLRVSNILEMERLASVAVGMIIDAMHISRGFLFLVDKKFTGEDQAVFNLRAVQSGERSAPAGTLDGGSPIARCLESEQRPLLQYDIDLLPAYQKAPEAERLWLRGLDTDVYIPIYSKGIWIGLMAFGAKLSGQRYSPNDLVVLATLAQQTAVALENARLVENLVQLNQQMRRAYRALDQANRNLEKLDRTKMDFISIASHELRTPLTVVRGYAGMLLDSPVIQQDAFMLQMVSGINTSSLRMHEIMESMFDLTQLDNRTLELHLQDVDLDELVRSAAAGLKAAAAEREVSLALDLPPLPVLKADPNILKKVFHHLLQNAIKFTPNKGRVSVTARVIPPSTDLHAGSVQVTVSDTGVGVDPGMRDLIFTKFYQTSELNKHSTGRTKFKGSGAGLGLALSKGIVEAHGGRIWVESPGHDEDKCPGSEFHISLPLSR